MGCFGYICVKCDSSIRGEERAVLKHIRHGEVLGETRGTYDSYGGVEEDEDFRGDHGGMNGHRSIWTSEFIFEDSIGYNAKVYKEKFLTWMEYREAKVTEGLEDLCDEIYEEWSVLPYAPKPEKPCSGVEAWHEYCYDRGRNTADLKNQHVISKSDPDQSWGKARKKFI